ncbi:MAG: hypothetical protein Q8L57_03775 [bacterium]|nr:hypothetical protein [bacterium]
MNNPSDFLYFLGLMSIGFIIAVALILGVTRLIKKSDKDKCLNCGGDIKRSNLFCPWCHCDLRGGGKG